jgi:hypothetical protein
MARLSHVDAIGMGLNLNIRRIIFSAIQVRHRRSKAARVCVARVVGHTRTCVSLTHTRCPRAEVRRQSAAPPAARGGELLAPGAAGFPSRVTLRAGATDSRPRRPLQQPVPERSRGWRSHAARARASHAAFVYRLHYQLRPHGPARPAAHLQPHTHAAGEGGALPARRTAGEVRAPPPFKSVAPARDAPCRSCSRAVYPTTYPSTEAQPLGRDGLR